MPRSASGGATRLTVAFGSGTFNDVHIQRQLEGYLQTFGDILGI